MNIDITRPDQSDIDEIKKHLKITISDTFKTAGVYESAYDEYLEELDYQVAQIKKDFQSGGKEEYFLIAKDKDKIIGTIGLGQVNPVIKKYCISLDKETKEIKAVYIHPDFQKKSVGSQLFTRMIQHLNDNSIEKFVLDCGYKQSQPFWIKKLGKPTIFMKDFYAKDSHHMIWQMDVKKM